MLTTRVGEVLRKNHPNPTILVLLTLLNSLLVLISANALVEGISKINDQSISRALPRNMHVKRNYKFLHFTLR